MKKLTGLKKAIGDYKRANEEGGYSPRYGYLMYDKEENEIWTDEFYSLGHNEWKVYHTDCIINIGNMLNERGINMKNVKEFIEKKFNNE